MGVIMAERIAMTTCPLRDRKRVNQPLYAKTSITLEFKTLHAGDVVRLTVSETSAFSDCVIMGFSYCCEECIAAGFTDDAVARLARPYIYASSVGTTCSTPLLGYETIDYVRVVDLLHHYRIVENGGHRTI